MTKTNLISGIALICSVAIFILLVGFVTRDRAAWNEAREDSVKKRITVLEKHVERIVWDLDGYVGPYWHGN